MDKRPLLVSIHCLVYNHEPFLRQCLDGFVMQQTNFRFEAVVHDDVSTDGSAKIIREYADKYPDIIKPIFETENQWSKGDGELNRIMISACTGKYVAMCEGDDYWTDPNKLQRQVDFLERNPEYSLCFHNAVEHWEDGSKDDAPFSNVEDKDYSGLDIFKQWLVPTASAVLKRDVLVSDFYEHLFAEMLDSYVRNKMVLPGDTIMFVSCAVMGKMHGFSDVSSVYRCHKGGATFSMSYLGYIKNYYYFQKFLPAPYKDCARDIFFKGAPHLYVSHFKSKSIRRDILKKSFDIGWIRTIREYGFYFFKVIIEKVKK